jgi:hypothetical protein
MEEKPHIIKRIAMFSIHSNPLAHLESQQLSEQQKKFLI